MTSPRTEFFAGVRAVLPILLGTMPFDLIYGVLAINAGLPVPVAIAMSSIVFAGSAQFIATQLITAGTLAPVIILTTFVVNLRHALYSASVAPHIKHLSAGWKWLLAYLLTDETYAIGIARYGQPPESPNQHWYFLGAGLTLWSSWQLSTIAGVLVGAQLPENWGLDFTLALTFIGILIPTLKDRPSAAAALAAGVVALLAAGLPLGLNLIVAAAVGIGVGMGLERLKDKTA